MSSQHSAGRGHVCCIVPPYILKHMAVSSHVPEETQAACHSALAHVRELHATRRSLTSQSSSGAHHPPRYGIVPNQILSNLAQSADVDDNTRESAQRTLEHKQAARQEVAQAKPAPKQPQGPHLYREVHDSHHSQNDYALPGKLVFKEGQATTTNHDAAVKQCYDNLGYTFDFYSKIFNRNSIDDKGLSLIGSVHFGVNYGNAYWNSKQMVFGDGNKFIYNFTKALDVIGHELTHGVTEHTAALAYHNQSGALNESISDVFGIMIKQHHLSQTAEQADWLIGEDCLLPDVKGVALRSMKAPGTAFDDPRFGKDPQPAHMRDYVQSSDDENGDEGGVHTNSGIPNHAFYLAAVGLGGSSWERAGKVWYGAINSKRITVDCDFKLFADITVEVAGSLFDDSVVQAVTKAWTDVGVLEATSEL
ncbi:hypothetical protein MMC30_001316 [Trapelia coarctata]|nr:hypothetical protein [Trapelia coarctata]